MPCRAVRGGSCDLPATRLKGIPILPGTSPHAASCQLDLLLVGRLEAEAPSVGPTHGPFAFAVPSCEGRPAAGEVSRSAALVRIPTLQREAADKLDALLGGPR